MGTNKQITEELLAELLDASKPDEFVDREDVGNMSLSQCLQELLMSKGLQRIDVIRAADLNETFGYQIFVGERGASRNKVLQLAFAMRLTLKETNRLLRAADAGCLYCKDRRDAIIIFCLAHGESLQEVNEELYRFGEDTIC